MSKLYCVMGKSSSGKDTLFKELTKALPHLTTIIPYTTRPMREGEQDGVEYFFVSEATLLDYEKAGKIIEMRSYQTTHGIWSYATIDDGQVTEEGPDYLVIGTLASYQQLRNYYGPERVVPLYIEVEDGERLSRALTRERTQVTPKYGELCRRFLADTEDFSPQRLEETGIHETYINEDKDECLQALLHTIRGEHDRIVQEDGDTAGKAYEEVMSKNPWLAHWQDKVYDRLVMLPKLKQGIFIGYVLYVTSFLILCTTFGDVFSQDSAFLPFVPIVVGICYIVTTLIVDHRLRFYRTERVLLEEALKRAYAELGYQYGEEK